ncbi:hypothetical protein E8D34_20165 [Nocardioides sp. GY 10113]|uniref:hypothetical protein n=1 Tax=Nocardioides sp. GY 10113 TaxID=2569761 RepID=UPI0010A83AC3|nr:hypothetical protein [Nocardioides sp. GY 10113]TIC79611.1 hypothetical protein E8D34_20240 [Nocardioides sp. GY 10113]TIC79642.1 hypothetical protein E8D34_20165 [Nocardioides sp. GY 10113]
MLPPRPTCAALTALLALPLLTTGCSTDEDGGPLDVSGYGLIANGRARPLYFDIDLCLRSDRATTITIDDVAAVTTYGDGQPEFAVTWADTNQRPRVMGGPVPLPDWYVPAVGADGAVASCDVDPDADPGNAQLAVVFPAVAEDAFVVDGVAVTYTFNRRQYTATSSAHFAQCPIGAEADSANDDPAHPCVTAEAD